MFRTLGPLFHFTTHDNGLDWDDWLHLGTRAAALDRLVTEKWPMAEDWDWDRTEGGLYELVVTGTIGPEISDGDAGDLWGGERTDTLDINDFQIWPYRNINEDVGSLSYLVHRSALRVIRRTSVAELVRELGLDALG